METCTHRKMTSAKKIQKKVTSMTKKGYYSQRMATLKAWKNQWRWRLDEAWFASFCE